MKFPQPENVEFGDCFVVCEITGGDLLTAVYSYYQICPQKFPDDGFQPPERDKDWYFVGLLNSGSQAVSTDLLLFDYKSVKQSLIKFTSLSDTTVKFVSTTVSREYKIRFESLQQGQEFYKMIYRDVKMKRAVSIGHCYVNNIVGT